MEVKPGYKLTEVGMIPEGWDVKRLRQISPSQSVGLVINPSSYYAETGTVPLLIGSNVGENRIDWESANRISTASNESLPASRLAAGDLVTVRVGDPGVTAVIPPALDGCNCASMMIVRRHQSFNSRWLCFAMNSPLGRAQVANVQYGTAQKQFNIIDAVDFIYPVPQLREQEAIAEALGDADALIESLDQLLTKKRHLKQGAMQQLLTGKKRLPGFSGDWEAKTLGSFCKITAGGDLVKEEFSPLSDHGHPFPIYSNALTNNGLYGYSQSYQHEPDKLTVTARGDIGTAAYRSTRFCAIGRLLVLSSVHQCDLRFVTEYINTFVEFAQESTGVPQLTAPQISKRIVALPPSKAEQTAIAAILSDMDTEIAAVESKLSKARLVKQGMMQELLTGRVRLV